MSYGFRGYCRQSVTFPDLIEQQPLQFPVNLIAWQSQSLRYLCPFQPKLRYFYANAL